MSFKGFLLHPYVLALGVSLLTAAGVSAYMALEVSARRSSVSERLAQSGQEIREILQIRSQLLEIHAWRKSLEHQMNTTRTFETAEQLQEGLKQGLFKSPTPVRLRISGCQSSAYLSPAKLPETPPSEYLSSLAKTKCRIGSSDESVQVLGTFTPTTTTAMIRCTLLQVTPEGGEAPEWTCINLKGWSVLATAGIAQDIFSENAPQWTLVEAASLGAKLPESAFAPDGQAKPGWKEIALHYPRFQEWWKRISRGG